MSDETKVSQAPSPDGVILPPNQSPVTDAVTAVDEAGNIPDKQDVDVEALIPKDSYQTDPLFYEIADYFNVAPEEYPIAKDKLAEIVDFVIRDTKSNDPSVILKAIRDLEDKVQPPAWGEKRYWNIQKYIRLSARENSIKQAKAAFERKPNG